MPAQAPRWQQLVRTAVLTVGTVEEWVGLSHYLKHDSLTSPAQKAQAPEYASRPVESDATAYTSTSATAEEWIAEWVELQPLSRFRGAQPTIDHPSELLQPSDTDPSDWAIFWIRTRPIVFRTLLGLRACSPYLKRSATSVSGGMEGSKWVAWLEDVLWALNVLLNQCVFVF